MDEKKLSSTGSEWDLKLRHQDQWRVWKGHIKAAAEAHEVWQYIDPDLSDTEIKAVPQDTSPPDHTSVNPTAANWLALTADERAYLAQLQLTYEKDQKRREKVKEKLAKINQLIIQRVDRDIDELILGISDPREQLKLLKGRFGTGEEDRWLRLRYTWRSMIAEPKGNMDQSKWLSTWSKLYYEAREAGVPDVCYESGQHKKDRAPI